MPTCQYCGKAVGNAGALTQHERACDHNPANEEPLREERDRTPARRDEQTTEIARGGAPGAGIADTLFVLANFDEMPTDVRREAVNQSAGIIGNAVNRWLDLRERSIENKRNRARNAELDPIEELPSCPECGYQFKTDDLTSEEVQCPECNGVYAVRLKDTSGARA